MSVIQNRLASTGLPGPAGRPAHVRYGEDRSMNLDNTNFVNGHDVQ